MSLQFFTYIFLLTIAVVLKTTVSVTGDTYPEGYTYFSFLNTAYKIHTEKLKWSDAKKKCVDEGATLAVIDTDAEIQVVASLKESQVYLWVGISRESKAFPWLGIDEETVVSYLPWAPNEPTCNYNCILLDSRDRGVTNRNCNLRKGFVCEIVD